MSGNHGRFIWYELITSDVPAAKAFYSRVLGWTMQDLPTAPGAEPYSIVSAGDYGLGGMMNLGEAMKAQGMTPNWTGYVCVDDLDASVAQAQALGAKLLRAQTDIPGFGRFAVIEDPAGAALILMTPTPPEGGRAAADSEALGQAAWHELFGSDPAKGFGFYASLFGWTKGQPVDMGPMGTYQLFSNADGEVGGMMAKPADMPMAAWLYYFRVADIHAAARAVTEGGGQVLMDPHQVPSGEWVTRATDPQGALFALVAKTA